ncbi:PhoD-like phosphatase-domain-containing protein [Lipomyces tetrasporus]|uniref:PhoD-like phosphatase-domain-containing protein n=1 Tax=Lipomyces tetrasporus TaxID=54092 RepID=A0AAD7QTB1_9ASCO|nr:PhoD-like phosphatase-domain-containing protein [Lipomyces tetrasporus]KAJ8101098.1 PhoD-like phosphatase-domain-containing protein [Lipomyces tetrasporus]
MLFVRSILVCLCAGSSTLMRLVTYVFLRWIPSSSLPKVIYSLFVAYFTLFFYIFSSERQAVLESEAKGLANSSGKATTAANNSSEKKTGENATVFPQASADTPQPRSLWSVLVWGVPSATRPGATLLTIVINVSLLAFALDLIYTSHQVMPIFNLAFTRAGYVSDTSARFVIREALRFPLIVRYRELDSSKPDVFNITNWSGWLEKNFANKLDESTDYTALVQIAGLKPATTYAISTPSLNSTFTTAPSAPGKFSFLSSSCIKARIPYNPFDHPLKINGFRIYRALLSQVDFFLFLGDFIYADVPILMGEDEEAYRVHYRHVYADLKLSGFNRLPMVHVFDDHEIINDYDPDSSKLYYPATSAWKTYQGTGNPPPVNPDVMYYTFERQGIPFFLMDTRSYRSLKHAPDGPNKTLLGKEQLNDLRLWLEEHRDAPFKIIVSSIPFTKNWRGIDMYDTWAGYLHERAIILKWFWDVGGVVILSGDRHEAAAIKFPSPDGVSKKDTYEFSASPLSQFYLPIRTHKQRDNEDVTIMYMPDGNSKVGKIDIETREDGSTLLGYQLYIDGTQRWNYTLKA